MTDRKRRRSTADALSRLTASTEELLGLSDALAEVAREQGMHRAVSLRVVSLPPSSSAASPAANASAKPTMPVSLVSLVSVDALRAKPSNGDDAVDGDQWKEKLLRLAQDLSDSDPEVMSKCERLLRRHEALENSLRVFDARIKERSDEVVMSEQVESQLAREEKEWEAQMQQREQRVAELEVELHSHERANESSFAVSEDEDEDDGATNGTEGDIDTAASKSPSMERVNDGIVRENESLRETLALRQEEKRDIEAAIHSMRRKKRQRVSEAADEEQVQSLTHQTLLNERKELLAEKQELQASILAMEEEQNRVEADQEDVTQLKDSLAAIKQRRQQATDAMNKQKMLLARLKDKMKHMVDIQVLTARDTNPPTIREEALILHLLFQHSGEMGVNELKQGTAELLAEYGRPNAGGVVIRALYSLVANGVVQIDRSFGSGLVTSLIV